MTVMETGGNRWWIQDGGETVGGTHAYLERWRGMVAVKPVEVLAPLTASKLQITLSGVSLNDRGTNTRRAAKERTQN